MVMKLMHVRSHQHPGEIPVKRWRKVEIRVREVGEKRRDDSVNHINVGAMPNTAMTARINSSLTMISGMVAGACAGVNGGIAVVNQVKFP